MGQIFFGEESKGNSSVTVHQTFNTNTFTLMEIFLANLVIIVPVIADIGETGNGDQQKLQTDVTENTEDIFKIKLPIKCTRDGEMYSLRAGSEGFLNARFQKLWYGFTPLNYQQFASDPEGCAWENRDGQFAHEGEIVAQYDENGNSEQVQIEVPPAKNVVFRVAYESDGEARTTPVFYVKVNQNL